MAQTFWHWVFGCLVTMFGGTHPVEPEVALLLCKPENLTIRNLFKGLETGYSQGMEDSSFAHDGGHIQNAIFSCE